MLVRSTFGLRGCPPNRRSAPHLRRIARPLCASHNSARFNGHSPFPHFHIPILPHYIRFGLWLWFWVVVWVMVWLWLSAFRVVVEGSAAKVSSPRSARWFSLRAKERERKNSPSPAALVRDSPSPHLTRDLRSPRTTLATAFGGDLRSVDIRAAFRETRPKLWLYHR